LMWLYSRLDEWWKEFYENNHDNELYCHIIILWVCLTMSYFGFGLTALVLDITHFPSFLYRTKIQKKKEFMIKGGPWNPSLLSLFGNLFLNFGVSIPLAMYAMYRFSTYLSHHYGLSIGLRMDPDLPSLFEVFYVAIFSFLWDEVFFFYSHWALHYGPLFRNIHKIHHEFNAPIALAAVYAHPIEAIVGNYIASAGGAYLCNGHILLAYIGAVVGIFLTQFHHCGYRLPFTEIQNQPDFHDFHHEKFNGNYSAFGLMDKIHGTDFTWKKVKEEKRN